MDGIGKLIFLKDTLKELKILLKINFNFLSLKFAAVTYLPEV